MDAPLEFKLAVKLVNSRQYALSVQRPINIGVVFAMWGEQNRLLSKSDTNPNGEDSLRTKIAQLDWITSDTLIDWTLYAVDDGCPHDSGKIAKEISNTHPLGEKVKVLLLNEAVPTDSGPLQELKSANDSRKAGAVILGCMQAISEGKDAVIYTDESFAKVPFAFIDSFTESASITQGPMTTWEALLIGLVKAVRRHGVPHNKGMARVLDEEIRSSADLDLLIHHLPPELTNVDAKGIGNPTVMSPEAVQAWIKQRKAEAAAADFNN